MRHCPTAGSSTPATIGTRGRRCTSPGWAGCGSSRLPVSVPARRLRGPGRTLYTPRSPRPLRERPASPRGAQARPGAHRQPLLGRGWPLGPCLADLGLLVVLVLGLVSAWRRHVQRRVDGSRPATRSTSPRAPGPSCGPPPSTSGWPGPNVARRGSRPAASAARCDRPPRTSTRWRGCSSGWSRVATGRWAVRSPSTRSALPHGARPSTPGAGRWSDSVVRERGRSRGWRSRLWPVSLVRGNRR